MTPIRFGPPSRRLFGLFHPADERTANGSAALLCNPFGHEAMRTHRFYRLLAERLSRQGVAVLRFDYYGTGDSPGTDEDGELQGWVQDILEAQRELLRRSGARRVVCFGARLGARLAMMAAPQAGAGMQRLVAWDPVVDGRPYLESLGQAQLEELEAGHIIPDPAWRRGLSRDPLYFSGESLGFAISGTLRAQLLELQPDSPCRLPHAVVVRVIASERDARVARWVEHAKAQNPQARIALSPFEHQLIWTSNPFAQNELVPAEALQKMVGELHER